MSKDSTEFQKTLGASINPALDVDNNGNIDPEHHMADDGPRMRAVVLKRRAPFTTPVE